MDAYRAPCTQMSKFKMVVRLACFTAAKHVDGQLLLSFLHGFAFTREKNNEIICLRLQAPCMCVFEFLKDIIL